MNVDLIKYLAKQKNASISKIEKTLGFGNGAIGKWSKQSPSVDNFYAVANYLSVSMDYLYNGEDNGKEEIRCSERSENSELSEKENFMFWKIFSKLCDQNNVKPSAVTKAIGLSDAIPTKWKNGAIPKAEILLKLSEYFNCSVDYLLKGDDMQLSKVEQECLCLFRQMHTADQLKFIGRMEQQLEINSFRAAKSQDSHEPEIVKLPDLSSTPETDEKF